MTAHEFEFSVSDLDASGKDYRFAVRPAWLRGILEGTEMKAGSRDGALEIRASKSGTDVVVHGTLTAELVTPCARCLKDALVKIDGPLSILLVPGKAGEDSELSPDQADVGSYEGETVVLDDVVKDEILLEIPMIPLCSEDCPGMSPGLNQKPERESAAQEKEEEEIDPR
ncbi:MAG: YceD family protein, partial [Polyangiaceae bacterium]